MFSFQQTAYLTAPRLGSFDPLQGAVFLSLSEPGLQDRREKVTSSPENRASRPFVLMSDKSAK